MSRATRSWPGPATDPAAWDHRARYFDSGSAFARTASPVPSTTFLEERDRAFTADAPTGLVEMDQSESLGTPFSATTPLVLSRYACIRAGETLEPVVRASVQILCILSGAGTSRIGHEAARWKAGDILVLPGAAAVRHEAVAHTVAWMVTDEPALAFMGVEPPAPGTGPVEPVHYLAEALDEQLEAVYRDPHAEGFAGYAVMLSQQRLEHSRNVHPALTLALNSLPAGQSQRAHRHNSMALTLCLDGEGCFSMVDGERKSWSPHAVMVTPPGAVHSHHNEGPRRMRCLIVQDGGFHGHARTMGFAYVD